MKCHVILLVLVGLGAISLQLAGSLAMGASPARVLATLEQECEGCASDSSPPEEHHTNYAGCRLMLDATVNDYDGDCFFVDDPFGGFCANSPCTPELIVNCTSYPGYECMWITRIQMHYHFGGPWSNVLAAPEGELFQGYIELACGADPMPFYFSVNHTPQSGDPNTANVSGTLQCSACEFP